MIAKKPCKDKAAKFSITVLALSLSVFGHFIKECKPSPPNLLRIVFSFPCCSSRRSSTTSQSVAWTFRHCRGSSSFGRRAGWLRSFWACGRNQGCILTCSCWSCGGNGARSRVLGFVPACLHWIYPGRLHWLGRPGGTRCSSTSRCLLVS